MGQGKLCVNISKSRAQSMAAEKGTEAGLVPVPRGYARPSIASYMLLQIPIILCVSLAEMGRSDTGREDTALAFWQHTLLHGHWNSAGANLLIHLNFTLWRCFRVLSSETADEGCKQASFEGLMPVNFFNSSSKRNSTAGRMYTRYTTHACTFKMWTASPVWPLSMIPALTLPPLKKHLCDQI